MVLEEIESLSKTTKLLLLDSLLQKVCIDSGSHVSHNLLYSGLKKAHSKKKSFSNRTTYNPIYVVEIHHLTKHPPAGSIGSDSVRVMVTKGKTVQNVYSNLYSQAVTHPSTNRSQPYLTSVIGRELVYSRWYGRRQPSGGNILMQIFKNGGHMYTWTTFILGHVTGLLAEWKIFLEEFCMNRLLWFLLQRCSVFESRIAFGLKTYS